MFTTKLKINSEFYFKNLQNLFHKIEELNQQVNATEEKQEQEIK